MAFVASTPLPRRKKQQVYGKSSRKAYSPANAGFFEDDESSSGSVARDSQKPPTTLPMRKSKASSPPPVAKLASPTKKPGSLVKPKETPARSKDPFDVPSDEEEGEEVYAQIPLPPKQRIKSRLVDEPKEETEQLAPWEKRAARKGALSSANLVNRNGKKLASENIEEEPDRIQPDSNSPGKADANGQHEADSDHEPRKATKGMTAMEKLAARRRQAQANSQSDADGNGEVVKGYPKRSVSKTSVRETSQSKRRRVTPQPESPSERSATADPASDAVVSGESSGTTEQKDSTDNGDIFDVPMDDDALKPTKPPIKQIASSRLKSRRPGTLRKVTPQKGLSAPSRLQDMLPDEDEDDIPMTDSAPPHDPITPRNIAMANAKRAPSTPPSGRNSASHGQEAGALTPKQTQLWADFFEPAAAPNTNMKKLSISEDKPQRRPNRAAHKMLQRSSSDVPTKRTRVVDRLKASATNTSEEDSSESEDETASDERPSMSLTKPEEVPSNTEAVLAPENLSQPSMSQERQTKPISSGSLITYAKQRSHLADDNLESALMFDTPMDALERPSASARRTGRPGQMTPSTTFDLDDVDEGASGGLRTIHELRAGGRNTRVMGEIEDLMGEIADHAATAKSRRRGALLDLTSKLTDKAFAEQVTGHGFEKTLLSESKVPSDPAADFLLATSLLLVLHSDVPDHRIGSFEEALPCFSRLLADPLDIARVVKERRSNMSKSAQADVVALAEKVRTLESLWGDAHPPASSSRIIALKAIDLAVRKLRKTGNKSDLLSSEAVAMLLPQRGFTDLENDPARACEAQLAISILEALKTLSETSNWPATTISAIASLPTAFAETWPAAPQHTKWLAYRLCANLTNDTSLDLSPFTSPATSAVHHLLADVAHGFQNLYAGSPSIDPALNLDLLVLAIGTLINLTEHQPPARAQAAAPRSLPLLQTLVRTFHSAQQRALDAESVEGTTANVALGYVAILLANVCQDEGPRGVVRGLLPGGKLGVLVEAVEEFVRHHRSVDVQEEGTEEGGFTARLEGVLVRLREGEEEG
ncbi:hypothetical protein WHR41_00680 [Cladosporium halotolerans]|uniref:Wings apart-like protein C-terminal domain-containing protein n=1 Tax=Cladosporium halotolerans TaxID=1052096 RepID=A0AB34L1T4_9PEZI